MAQEKTPKCCICCHVKVGTFILAILILFAGIMGIVFASLLLTNTIDASEFMTEDLFSNNEEYEPVGRTTMWVIFGNGAFITLIAGLAMYGLLKKRAGFLLPMFILQLFNFMCTVVAVGRVMFYWPSVKYAIIKYPHLPDDWKVWLLQRHEATLVAIIFTVLFGILFIKSYLISMVYRCYKDITTQAMIRIRRDPEISCVAGADSGKPHIYKPPKYEDIQKVPLFDDVEEVDTKPPPYAA